MHYVGNQVCNVVFMYVCFRTSRMACTSVHSNLSMMLSGFFTTVSFTMEVSKIRPVCLCVSMCLSTICISCLSVCLSIHIFFNFELRMSVCLSVCLSLGIVSILVEGTLTDNAKVMIRVCKREVKNCNHVCVECAMMMSIVVFRCLK